MKRLVICCDGTWNKADQSNDQGEPIPTNVTRIAYRVANRDNGHSQVIYYDQGVGTGNFFDRVKGGVAGKGLEEHIFEAYRFLVANYEANDEIFIFGFSRGAFTARSIAGMIRNSGILKRTKILKYKEALRLYLERENHPDDKDASAFRKANSVLEQTPIKFIGLWDTVGALGIPTTRFGLNKLTQSKYEFHDATLSSSVEHAYHALAIDEHRKQFVPTLWDNEPKPLQSDPTKKQKIEQVWFCGAHSDVGGGYEPFGHKSLSDISLQWMIDKATGAGLAFDQSVLKEYQLTNDCCAALHDSHSLKYGFAVTREIGKTPTEYLHRSALDRWEKANPEYRPKELAALNRIPQLLAVQPRADIVKL